MTMPEITMIIPTRHRPHLLEPTLLSLLTARAEAKQRGLCDVRLLVVDDAPDNDSTRQLVAETPHADYLRIDEHDGRADPGAAIKLGVAQVDTEYQSLFGDDEIALPRHFVAAAELIREGFDVVSSSFRLVDASLRETKTVVLPPSGLGDLLVGRMRINDGSFVRHALVRDMEWDVSLEGQMLVPIWARLLVDERKFAVVQEPTWLYRRHHANISHEAWKPRDVALRARAKAIVDDLVAAQPHLVRRLYSVTEKM